MKVWAVKKGNKYYDGLGYFGELAHAEFYPTKKRLMLNHYGLSKGLSKNEQAIKLEIKEIK